jgi:hypothetical protein
MLFAVKRPWINPTQSRAAFAFGVDPIAFANQPEPESELECNRKAFNSRNRA